MNNPASDFVQISHRLHAAESARAMTGTQVTPPPVAGVRLLAVSKTRSAAEVRSLAMRGQRAFGENYVQEAIAKQRDLADLELEWHLIGHLQSNKAREAAAAFDWVQSVDRIKLAEALAQHRPPDLAPLNVLIQVNIDDEASKHGCRPDAVPALAEAIFAQSRLRLRGLMVIPAPHPDMQVRRLPFALSKTLFDRLRAKYSTVDILSMGMSDDFELAIAEGSTMVRIGTALFGERHRKST
jgi:pyridoxal phosphate enzyme (YggS family)